MRRALQSGRWIPSFPSFTRKLTFGDRSESAAASAAAALVSAAAERTRRADGGAGEDVGADTGEDDASLLEVRRHHITFENSS